MCIRDRLYTALEVLTRTVAPLLPLTTEEIWRGLTGGRSVHLQDWPDATTLPSDHALVTSMDRAREVCSAAPVSYTHLDVYKRQTSPGRRAGSTSRTTTKR